MTIDDASRQAFDEYRPREPGDRWRVYCFIRDNPMATRDEIIAGTGLLMQTTSPRVSGLKADGLVRVVDHRGKSDAGKTCGRLMVTAKPYFDGSTPPPPTTPPVQRDLPFAA